jgi:hypothetical protein
MSAVLLNLLKEDERIKRFDLFIGGLLAFNLLKEAFIKAPLL